MSAHNVAAAAKSRLRTPRLVIIEFILEELSPTGNTGKMLYLSLASNYSVKRLQDIHHEQICFDFKTDEAMAAHVPYVAKRVAALKKM